MPEQGASMEYPTMTATAPQSKQPEQNERVASETSTSTRLTNNRLPQFNQVMEVASLQPQKAASWLEQKDPLDKYSSGITTPVHEAHPSSIYARIKQEVLDDWRTMEGETLLTIPFGSDTEAPELHNEIGDCIFNAVGEALEVVQLEWNVYRVPLVYHD
jgi:hypothetical protein